MAKRVGRPTKAAEPGRKVSLGLKVTPAIKDRLEQSAHEAGRTQSQEAEYRLERSFDRQNLLNELRTLLAEALTNHGSSNDKNSP